MLIVYNYFMGSFCFNLINKKIRFIKYEVMWLVSIGKVINFRNFYFIICNFFKFKFDNYENRCFLVMKGVRVL